MPDTLQVIKFHRISFDENWVLLSLADQVFTYETTTKKIAIIAIVYELPTGIVETALIETLSDTKAYVHRDVIHVKGQIRITKGEL
jgi:hypothetical protein